MGNCEFVSQYKALYIDNIEYIYILSQVEEWGWQGMFPMVFPATQQQAETQLSTTVLLVSVNILLTIILLDWVPC